MAPRPHGSWSHARARSRHYLLVLARLGRRAWRAATAPTRSRDYLLVLARLGRRAWRAAAVPAADLDVIAALIMLGIGALAALIGIAALRNRDLKEA